MPSTTNAFDVHGDIRELDARVTGIENSISKLSGAVENSHNLLSSKIEQTASKIEQTASSIYTRLDQQQRETRPNILGWAGAAFAAITVSLTIGGAFGGLWKTSVDERFIAMLSAVRDIKSDMVTADKEIRGTMLTRDEYDKRSSTEVARRQDQFTGVGDRIARAEAEVIRLRDGSATKDDRALIAGRFQEQTDRIREELRYLRDRLDGIERNPVSRLN